MAEFAPVSTVEDLDQLDAVDVFDGYFSGLSGEPEPGNNHSRAFWHGWRNGAVDGGFREKDAAQAALARAVAEASTRPIYDEPPFDRDSAIPF